MTAGSRRTLLGSDIPTIDTMVCSARNGAPSPGIQFSNSTIISSHTKAEELLDTTEAG